MADIQHTHTHEYDCIVCGAHFDNSRDLARHNEEQHLKNAQGMEQPRHSDPDDDPRDRASD